MAEEEAWIKQTQETLGTLITKPKMTEKYLKKPPFRFLHDIVMEVTRASSFGQGLYTPEECDAAQLQDKQAKVDFLNKAISCVSFALGEKIDVSANKIVAGLEADKTNNWLQKLHLAATACTGPDQAKSDEAVQRILRGDSVAEKKKEKKAKKEEEAPAAPPPEAPAAAADDGGAAAAQAAAEEQARKEEEKRKRAERKRREEEKKQKEAAAAAEAAAAEAAAAEAAAAEAVAAEAAPPQEDPEEEERRLRKEQEAAKKAEDKRRREQRKREEEAQRLAQEQAQQAQMAAEAAAAQEQAQYAAYQAAQQQPFPGAQPGQEPFPEGVPSAPGSAAQPTRPPAEPAGSPEEIAARAQQLMNQGEEGQGPADDMGSRSHAHSRPDRPRTAGRRPPKVTSKVKESSEAAAPADLARPAIFNDGPAGADDDDDTFEAPQEQEANLAAMGNITAQEGAQHGMLVNSLLDAKKKEEEKERLKREEEATREEFDEGEGKGGIKMGKLKRKKDQQSQGQDVDVKKLTETIQTLCQAANPLGKSIDLVHQDIAHMGKELDQWKQEYRDASEAYQKELKTTEDMLLPLYQKMAELDEKIAEQTAKIRNSRSRISKNDVTIQGLLESVVMVK